MRYKKIISAVLCFFILFVGSLPAFSIDDNVTKILHMMPLLKSFLQALIVQYPSKTFALCVTEDCFPVIVDASYIQTVLVEDEYVTRSAQDAFTSPQEEFVVSADAAVNVPLTAFHTASMSAQNGYHELPRPAKIVIQARVLSRPAGQPNVAASHEAPVPSPHLRPSAPHSPWRSISDSAVLFWIFATVLPSL